MFDPFLEEDAEGQGLKGAGVYRELRYFDILSPISCPAHYMVTNSTFVRPAKSLDLLLNCSQNLQQFEMVHVVPLSRASLTVRFTVKNGDPPGAGKIWEN